MVGFCRIVEVIFVNIVWNPSKWGFAIEYRMSWFYIQHIVSDGPVVGGWLGG